MSVAIATNTVGGLRRVIAKRLGQAFAWDRRDGTPALDARIIIAQALGVEANALPLFDERGVSPEVEAQVLALADRRIAGEPVARIVGEKEFWGLTFRLSPETLVPRPDTETVVAAALSSIDGEPGRGRPLTILDIGTGSGAILIALLSELPLARGVGTDLAFGALVTARENAARLGVGERADFVLADWAAGLGERFDIVVANPPYIASHEIDDLPLEVQAHDPHLALNGGKDGLDAYRAVIADLPRLLKPQGRAFIEVGMNQADAVATIGREQAMTAAMHRDLARIERVVEFGFAGPR
jgi:release factor glutamine methyltransferase